jgi:pimeloyl-ACP methyl ester carboxylesterase
MSKFIRNKNLIYLVVLLITTSILTSCNSEVQAQNDQIQSKYTELGTQRVHYFEVNKTNNNPIILLTGVGTTSSFWNKNFIMCLAKSHHLYILDYPGIKSSVPPNESITVEYFAKTTNNFVTKLNIQHPQLIGWSMGGSNILETSFQAPNIYNHLYLISAYVPSGENISYPFPEHEPFKTNDDILNYVYTNNIHDYDTSQLNLYTNQLISKEITEIFPSLEYTNNEIENMITWGNKLNTIDNFKKSTVSATFIIPDHDTVINEAKSKLAIANYGGKKKVIVVQDSGHDVSLQYPDETCNLINDNHE